MEDFIRRLPVYLLLDCSSSMAGEPIEAVRQGMKALIAELKGDPQALETAYLSVITFDSWARQIIPLTPLMNFKEPPLYAGGVTSLGAALRLLMDCIEREVHKTTEEQKGDWKPLAFLLTDGAPTDEWEETAEKLRTSSMVKFVACAAGAEADTSILKHITESVLMMNTVSAGDLSQFFAWVSDSVIMGSGYMEQGEEKLPPLDGFQMV